MFCEFCGAGPECAVCGREDKPDLRQIVTDAAVVCDQAAGWLAGDESYNPELIAEELAGIAMDLRTALREVAA